MLPENKIGMNISTIADKLIGAKNDQGKIIDGNGFIEANVVYKDPSKAWLTGIVDVDDGDSANWIRSGEADGDVNVSNGFLDPNEVYEGVIGGTWAPSRLTSSVGIGAPKLDDLVSVASSWDFMASVDIVFTSDTNKWSRTMKQVKIPCR